ncbi:hypothetical protein QWJ34_11130 [Saccharibacillus sp. CPCC 101409]|uniref:hypothetical protein n=1 Tax=Saccharibacillus sp. CPCC 101409 TaxID=3058041 RepID=UPI0026710725|nr:hypothetical protein [Saccharibacillus sp. CPCC 101409]MDO3410315.1 hypothetical protein [Saccharibacillus sp. CPCC 101409]
MENNAYKGGGIARFCLLLFAATALVGLAAAVYLGMRELWVGVYLTTMGTVLFAFFAHLLRRGAFPPDLPGRAPDRNYRDLVMLEEIEENMLPEGRILEALIAKEGWTSDRRKHGYTFWIGANLVLRYEGEDGRIGYAKCMPLRSGNQRDDFDTAIRGLRAAGVPVYTTELNLREMKAEDFVHEYELLPKRPDDGTVRFELGKRLRRRKEYPYPLKTPGMMLRERRANRENDRRFFRPAYNAVLALNFLLGLLWISNWTPLPDGGFQWPSDAQSGSFALVLFNLTALAVIGRYWRGSLSGVWYRLPADVLAIVALQLAGLSAAGLRGGISMLHYTELLIVNGFFAFFAVVLFVIIRRMTALDRKFVTLDETDERGRKKVLSEPVEEPRKTKAVDMGFGILFVILLAVEFFVTWRKLPNWTPDAETQYYEGLVPFMLLNIVSLPIAGAYWRRRTKWPVPFYGAAAVLVVQTAGAMLGGIEWQPIAGQLFANTILTLVPLYVIFLLLQGIGWLIRRRKKSGRSDAV